LVAPVAELAEHVQGLPVIGAGLFVAALPLVDEPEELRTFLPTSSGPQPVGAIMCRAQRCSDTSRTAVYEHEASHVPDGTALQG
jgi:hypothetical protein